MKPKQILPLLLLAVIWGCYYVASQQAVKQMSVFSTGIVIRFLTMLLLFAVMGAKKELGLLLHTKGILGRLLLVGVLGFLLDLTAFIGLTLSPAGSGTALLKCDIIFVNLISVWIYKQRFSKKEWLYSLFMLFGVFLVMGVDFGNLSLGSAGSVFFLLSALFVSINAFVIKSLQTDKENPAADHVVAFYNNFVTMLLFTAAALVMGTFSQIGTAAGDMGLLLALFIAGLGQFGIYQVYYYDLRRFPVWLVKVFLLFMPVVSLSVSFLLFGEQMGKGQYLGILVLLLGALGILLEQRKKGA